MQRTILPILILLATTISSVGKAIAEAQVLPCESYVGRNVTPVTFDTAVGRLSKLTPKGEFETTAAYESRRAAALVNGGTQIISKNPERTYIKYDADNQQLTISEWAFTNGPVFLPWEVL